MSRLDEQFSEQFHRFEQRGRGWNVYEQPVCPEPPFVRFDGHYLPESEPLDDGARPTFLSSLVQKIAGALSTTSAEPSVIPTPEEEPEPEILERNSLVELQVSLPAKFSGKPNDFAQILSQLSFCIEPVSFEILGTSERIITQFAVHPGDAPALCRQLKAYFNEAVIIESEGVLQSAWTSLEGCESAVVEFGLQEEFFSPLANVQHDPFIGLIGAMAELAPNELALFQVIFQPVTNKWADSVSRAVSDATGKPFFVNAPELAHQAQEKISSPLFAAVVRIAAQALDFDRSWTIARDMASTLGVFNRIDGNELIPLSNDDYPYEEHCGDVVLRQSRRSGMILNAEELLGLVHLPSAAVLVPKLVREVAKTKPVPKAFSNRHDGLLLGINSHTGQTVEVRLTEEQRGQHMHIMGVSGSGKSTLLLNIIRQDIENGEGVAVLDPHGDLIDRILEIVPAHRIADVVLIDPSDEAYSVGFNILSAHSDLEKTLLASDLVSVFQRLSTSWGDQMGSVLQNAIMAFLESSEGGTISDLRRFLIEPAFRNQFLGTVRDPDILYYWRKGFAQLSGNKSIGPVLTRLETFLSPKPIRYMVSQRKNQIDFAKIMDTGKIFLAKLSQGQIGKENAFLLGSLFVAKFQETAMARQAQESGSRRPFWLYIDEFHNFITPSMAEILTGARKYRLGLILAHQELRQLQRDSEVASAVLANPYTRICFRLGDEDARKMADGFAFFEAHDLQNLDRGNAICRLERSDYDFNLAVSPPLQVEPRTARETRQQVIASSRKTFGTPRAEIEAEIMRSLGTEEKEPVKETKAPQPPKPEVREKPVERTFDNPPKPTPIVSEPTKPSSASILASEVPKSEIVIPASKPKEGRGGEQHTTIQMRIKAAALALGFGAETENETPDGKGSADLVIQNAHRSIACEIAVTTTIDHEFGNVTKCLKAGFHEIAVISSSPTRLKQIEEAVKGGLGQTDSTRISYYSPDAFIAYLEKISEEDSAKPLPTAKPSEKIVRGRVVRRHSSQLSEEERQQQEKAQIETLANALRKKKKKTE